MTVRSMRSAMARREPLVGRKATMRLVDAALSPVQALPRLDETTIARHTAVAREIYVSRRRRAKFLPADLFGEPTWDILIDLYIAAREQRRVPTTSACIGANVPPTTALRWLRILEARGMVEREDDGRDGRRTFVCLTAHGLAAMDATLADLLKRGMALVDELRPQPDQSKPDQPEA